MSRLIALAMLAGCILLPATSRLSAQESTAVAQRTQQAFQVVDQLLQAHIGRRQIAGATAIVTVDGETWYQTSFGWQDLATNQPMRDDTIFRIASMTKPITSAAIMMLVEDGTLRLDTPLATILPEFADMKVDSDPDNPSNSVPAERPITIHDLLTHRSGLTYGMNLPPENNPFTEAGICDGLYESDFDLAENTRRIARMPLARQPGSQWQYGLSTDVLGRVIEVCSNQPLDTFFARRIFQPLGMNDTSFVVPAEKLARFATLYGSDSQRGVVAAPAGLQQVGSARYSATYQLPDASRYRSGGAGLVSTASDYTKFLTMLLNEGRGGGQQLLQPESVRRMRTNQIGELKIAFPVHGDKFGYGFGIHEGSAERNGSAVGTYSWAGMFHTYFWVDPEQNMTAVLMTQLFPAEQIDLWASFQRAVNTAVAQARVDPRTQGGR
jgi:CubicO group peptidase (beta-lactamase class C family)